MNPLLPIIYLCPFTADPIRVDGVLDEPIWKAAPAVRLRRSSDGAEGRPATTLRLCWSRDSLYAAFTCEDPDIWGSMSGRDDPIYDEEVVELFLSPDGDVRTYCEIEISPRNVVFDAVIRNPDLDRRTMTTDLAWTCGGLESAVSATTTVHTSPPKARAVRGPAGIWTVEVRIPFRDLPNGAAPTRGTEWRANFYRIDRGARSSYLAWSPTLKKPADFHVPDRFGVLRFVGDEEAGILPGRWDDDRAWRWYRKLPWIVGCNFTPSTASNQLEFWQPETFDPATIERELRWASELGMNAVRVYLHDLAWQVDHPGLRKRLDRFLGMAWRYGIRTVLVLFDDCWNPDPRPGPQRPPIPGVHNSRWLQSPGVAIVNDPSRWDRLEAYVKDMVGSFRSDRRILMWDLYNEPGNSGQGVRSLPLLRKAFEWARACNPSQPLTAGVWADLPELNDFQLLNSDVVTFHNYRDRAALESQIADLKRLGRPIVCTEWMSRPTSTIATHLPVFKEQHVGCIMWGLVAGKTQTIYPWGAPEGSPEPAVWFHDVLRPDGTPFDAEEAALLRRLTRR